jgi:hypothetical protein
VQHWMVGSEERVQRSCAAAPKTLGDIHSSVMVLVGTPWKMIHCMRR